MRKEYKYIIFAKIKDNGNTMRFVSEDLYEKAIEDYRSGENLIFIDDDYDSNLNRIYEFWLLASLIRGFVKAEVEVEDDSKEND
ncbi:MULTISPECIES: hypothetical protein [Aerococcus]|uniref:Uncharacterized protein n=4 Tax=Aerococcus TaxID=1375 RepID=A0A329PGF5_9LACT|nr:MULTISPECIES: hypothetical protein [Aerococcus]MDK6355846.1 hypothetical protein [Escherichia coli]KAA9242188.1 hypothetical protein F6I34_01675 [Aerococcus urinae]KAA9298669.1 hypothetical protein F6I08_04830 [Aerococcus tenax]MCY3026199.1 hypothetical protein [Aerococcus loyolae]MCY3035189.1 hypothetical protein [Aerococcus mictus]